MVFVASKYTADLVATKLRRLHISAEAFTVSKTQGKREQVIQISKPHARQNFSKRRRRCAWSRY